MGYPQEVSAVDFVDILLIRVYRSRNKGHAFTGERIADMLEVAFRRVAAVIIMIRAAVGDDNENLLILSAFEQPFTAVNHRRAVAVAASRGNIHQPELVVAVDAIEILVVL